MKFTHKWFGLLVVVLGLAACSQQEAAPTATATAEVAAANTATATAVPATATALPPTAVPTETAVPPTATPEVVASNCLDCHSNQELLIEVAAPVEETGEGESSGVG